MTVNPDFDRLLAEHLSAADPHDVPSRLLDSALDEARTVRQRRPRIPFLDRRAWPGPLSAPRGDLRYAATIAAVLLLVAAMVAGLLVAGGRLFQADPLLVVTPTDRRATETPEATGSLAPAASPASTRAVPRGPCAAMVQLLSSYVLSAESGGLPGPPQRTAGRGDLLVMTGEGLGASLRRFDVSTGIPRVVAPEAYQDPIFPSMLPAHPMSRIAVSPDLRALAIEEGDLRLAGCGDPILVLADGGRIRPFPSQAFELVSEPVWAPDGSALYAVRRPTIDEQGEPYFDEELGQVVKGPGTILRWDTSTGEVTELPGGCGTCNRLSVSVDGSRLVAEATDVSVSFDEPAEVRLYEEGAGWRPLAGDVMSFGWSDATSVVVGGGPYRRVGLDGTILNEWNEPCCHGTGFGGPLSPDGTTMADTTMTNDFLHFEVTLVDVRDGTSRAIWSTRDSQGCERFEEGSIARADCEAQGLASPGPNAFSGYARVVAWSPDGSAVLLLDQNPDSTESRLFIVPLDGSGPTGFATFDAPDLFFLGFPNLGPAIAWLPD